MEFFSFQAETEGKEEKQKRKTKEFEQQKFHFCVMIIYQKIYKEKKVRRRKIMQRKSGFTRYTYIFNNTMMMTLVATAVS